MWFRRKNGAKRKNGYRSRWKTAGIIMLCLILGLLLGGGAGYLVQRELKSTKASKTSKTKVETTRQDEGTTPKDTETSTLPASTTPSASTIPAVETKGKTPAEAMVAYLKAIGVETDGLMFSVVSTSKIDPNWKLDKGTKTGEQPLYFVVHYVNGSWTVLTYGTQLTVDEIAATGAPSDLKLP